MNDISDDNLLETSLTIREVKQDEMYIGSLQIGKLDLDYEFRSLISIRGVIPRMVTKKLLRIYFQLNIYPKVAISEIKPLMTEIEVIFLVNTIFPEIKKFLDDPEIKKVRNYKKSTVDTFWKERKIL